MKKPLDWGFFVSISFLLDPIIDHIRTKSNRLFVYIEYIRTFVNQIEPFYAKYTHIFFRIDHEIDERN
jgi:hypothetical protein